MHGPRSTSRPAARASYAPPPAVVLSPAMLRPVVVGMAAVLVVLALGHLLFLLLPSVELLGVLDLSIEQAVGTWVASTLHLVCAALAAGGAVLARRERSRWTWNWALLAVVFLVLSVDETAAGHDRLVVPLQSRFETSGALLYPWVVVAGVLGLAFLVVQLGFLRSLGRTGKHLVMAGTVFVLGAVGLEMVEGVVASPGGPGRESLLYDLLVLAEELLEVGAVMWVVCILVVHLCTWLGNPRLVLVPSLDVVVDVRDDAVLPG